MQLTPEQLKQNAAAMIAHAEGKPVEWVTVGAEPEHGGSGHWDACPLPRWDFADFLYRPKPWTLPEPPKGKQWHRTDWTEDMLPEGYRPLLDGELAQMGDEYYFIDEWCSRKEDGEPVTSEKSKTGKDIWCLHRTTRPLPTEPKTRPLRQDDITPQTVFKSNSGAIYFPTAANLDRVYFCDSVVFERRFYGMKEWTVSFDGGTTFGPCEVAE